MIHHLSVPVAILLLLLTVQTGVRASSAPPVPVVRYDLPGGLIVELPKSWQIVPADMAYSQDAIYDFHQAQDVAGPPPDETLLSANGFSKSGANFTLLQTLTNAAAPPLALTHNAIVAYDTAEHQKTVELFRGLKGTTITWEGTHRRSVGDWFGMETQYVLHTAGPPRGAEYSRECLIHLPGKDITVLFLCDGADRQRLTPVFDRVLGSLRALKEDAAPLNPVLADSPFKPAQKLLRDDPIARELCLVDQETYEEIETALADSVARHEAIDNVLLQGRVLLLRAVTNSFAHAPAADINRYMRAQIDEVAATMAVSPDAAYALFHPGDHPADLRKMVPADLRQQESNAAVVLLRDSFTQPDSAHPVDLSKAKATLAALLDGFTAEERKALQNGAPADAEKPAVAAATLKLYRAIAALPADEAANVWRANVARR